GFATLDALLKDLLEERDAPAAAGPGPAALRQLARHPRPVDPHEVDELPPRHVEAVANLGVLVHAPLPEVLRRPAASLIITRGAGPPQGGRAGTEREGERMARAERDASWFLKQRKLPAIKAQVIEFLDDHRFR